MQYNFKERLLSEVAKTVLLEETVLARLTLGTSNTKKSAKKQYLFKALSLCCD